MSARKLAVFAFVIGTGILGQQAHAENCFELLADDAAFDACSARQDERRLGKYFCFVTYTAGIQYPTKPDGTSDVTATPYIGSIKSKSNKFFMEVQKNPASKPTPCVSKKTMEMACTDESAPFILTSKSDDIPSSAFGYNTLIFRSYQNTFLFNGDFSFAAYMGYQNSYLTHGKCEKIN